MKMNVIKLENGIDYVIMDMINIDDKNYIILINEKDTEDICVRKIVNIDGVDNVVKLDSNEELEQVLGKFSELHRKDEKSE